MQRLKWILAIIVILSAIVSCSPNQSQPAEPDYQKIKEITLDVLHTGEGKKVLEELMQEQEFKQKVMMKSQEIEKAVSKTFTDPKMKKEWENILKKPEVATNLAQATEEQIKQLLKTLMKDPEFQKMLIEIFKDPQMSEQLLQILKSQKYREETRKVMEELMQVPSIQKKLGTVLKQAAQQQQQGGESEESQGGGSQEGGGQQGGGGQGGGGG
ncbi:MAG: spore germination lipoprotein GerD [Thermoactinomyces sp.]